MRIEDGNETLTAFKKGFGFAEEEPGFSIVLMFVSYEIYPALVLQCTDGTSVSSRQ